MKRILTLIGAAAVLFAAVNLQAQTPTVGTVPLAISNSLSSSTPLQFTAGTVILTNGPLISLKQQQVAILSTLGTTAAGSNIFLFAPGNGISFDTNTADLFGVTNSASGASPSETTVKNINAQGYGALKLVQVITIGPGTITNLELSYFGKLSCP